MYDPFDPQNGPPFSLEFQRQYRGAQRARNERITDWALASLAALEGTRARDRLFNVYRTWADLRMIDPAIEPSDRRPNWCYLGGPVKANYGVFGIGTLSTLRSWLSMWSLRTSQCTAAPHLGRITVPSLVVPATADTGVYETDDCKRTYEELNAKGVEMPGPPQGYGEKLGVAFQLVDDLLDVAGDPAATGKAMLTDLREGKMTYPLILAMEREPDLVPALERACQADDGAVDPDLAARIARAMGSGHVAEDCMVLASRLCNDAIRSLSVLPSSRARAALESVALATPRRRR